MLSDGEIDNYFKSTRKGCNKILYEYEKYLKEIILLILMIY